ncbi:type IV secretory system conjugative DNA transfer family protein [Agrobacterium cavarae]|uniref:Type IV secretory system conjugative DNA transfer family protein n=1 Tax=Agrobacterium cavarae TaxID=2528239 RepID=A0ABY1YCS8_9HYPH|nr:type IV secretory system conjugative DNA transfer family protein [Agrobacterium cavarae]TBN14147.1 type IV secretory system conjugative DNA transfer family protein [Agrobacterium cavarae]
MTVWGFAKPVVTAPFLGAICAAIGWVNAGTIIFLDFVVHWALGAEQGVISQVLLVVAKHLPLVFGVFGFMGAFVSEVPVQSVFGTARWASTKDIALMRGKDRAGLIIGRDPQTKTLLRYDGPSHLMTMAPTRTGKGVGTVIPNLLTLQRSVICIDPKGENARITARARERFGALHVLEPFGVTDWQSSCFNPFAHLDANDLDIAEHAGTLADALVYDEPGSSGDAHWNEEARALIAGLIMMVVASEPPHLRHPATLRDYLTRPPKAFADLLTRMQESTSCDGLIARAANRHLGKSDREASGVLSSAQRHTHFLDSPRMKQVMERSDFQFIDLKQRTQSVFLVLPPDRLGTYARWLRLMITQSLTEMVRDRHGASPSQSITASEAAATSFCKQKKVAPANKSVLFLLDEFASLGRLDAVVRAMGLMAGYGVQLWPILQDIHQLRALYGKGANTFLANAGVLQVFGVNDIETAELVARSIGKRDAHHMTASHSEGKQTNSEHIAARNLINADEIMRLPDDRIILLRQGHYPAKLRKIRYYEDKEFKDLFERI